MSFLEEYEAWKKHRQQGTSSAVSQERMDEIQKKYTEWKVKSGKVNISDLKDKVDSRVNTWLENDRNYTSNYASRFGARRDTYGNRYVDDASHQYKLATKQKERFDIEAESILNVLEQYQDYFDQGWMDSVRTSLGAAQEKQSEIVQRYADDDQYWAQFGNEEGYLRYLYPDKYEREDRQSQYNAYSERIEELKKQKAAEKGPASGYLTGSSQQQTSPYAAALQAPEKKKEDPIDAEISRMETWNRNYERGNGEYSKVIDDYADIAERDDFKTVSAKKDYGNPTKEDLFTYDRSASEGSLALSNGGSFDDLGNIVDREGNIVQLADGGKIHDRLGLYLSASEEDKAEAYNLLSASNGNYTNTWANLIQTGDEGSWNQLSENEVAIYYYLLNNDGQEAADKYLDDMKVELNSRETLSDAQRYSDRLNEASTLGKIGLSLATVPAQVIGGGISFVDDAVNLLQGKETNPYSAAHALSHFSNVVRSEQAAKLEEITGGAAIPFVNFSVGDLYQAGMSVLDMGAGSVLGANTYGVLMGMGAASNEAERLYEQGASVEQIALGGALAGAAEMVFEKYSIENLIDLKDTKTVGQLVKNALIQGGVEASEEGFTEIANTLTNALVMGSRSDWAKLLEENDGDVFAAFLAKVSEVASASLGGFVSGFGSGFTHSAMDYVAGKVQDTKTGQYIDEHLYGSDALMALAEEVAGYAPPKLQGRLEAQSGKLHDAVYDGNGNRGKAAGKLYGTVRTAIAQQNQADIAKGLEEKGFSPKQAKAIAEAAAASMNGEKLTERQQKTLDRFQNDNTVRDVVLEVAGGEQATRLDAFHAAIATDTAKTFRGGAQTASQGATQTAPRAAEQTNAERAGKVFGAEKMPSAGRYEVSDNGSAQLVRTGEPVSIRSVAEIRDGKMTLELEDGRKVSAEEVSYASEDEALVYEAVAEMGVNASAANVLVGAYHTDTGVSAEAYSLGVKEAYKYGQYNFPMQEVVNGPFSSMLTDHQRNTAYRLGQMFSEKLMAEAQAKVRANRVFEKSALATGRVHFDGDRNSLTERQRESIAALEIVADALGVQIHIFESGVDADGQRTGANGWYDAADSTIHIDLYSGVQGKDTMLFTAAHELTHFIRDWSPAKFKGLADFLMQEYGKQGVSVDTLVQNQIIKAKRGGRDISYDTAFEEVVADSMETMLSDGKVVEKLAKLKAQDKTLWEKLKDFFRGLAEKIRAAYKGLKPDSVEGRFVAEMKDAVEQLQELFTEGLTDAGDNFQRAEKNTVQEGGSTKFCVRDNVPSEFNPDGQTLEEQLSDILDGAQSFDGRYLYIGKFTPEFRKVMEKHTEIKDLPIVMNYRDAYLAMESKEHGRYQGDGINYHNLGIDGMMDAINSFDTPDVVMLSKKEGKIELVLEGTDHKGNKMLSVVALNTHTRNAQKFIEAHIVTSIYGRRNIEKYVDKARGEGRLVYDKKEEPAQGIPQVQYEGNINADSYKTSIRNSGPEVNKKFSLRDSDGSGLTDAQAEYFQDDITSIEAELSEVTKKRQEAEQYYEQLKNDPTLVEAESRLSEIRNSSESRLAALRTPEYKTARQERDAIKNQLGIDRAMEEMYDLKEQERKLRKEIDSAVEYIKVENARLAEEKAVAAAGMSEADYFRNRAEQIFGTTKEFKYAGYLLPDGKMLDFTSKEGKQDGKRDRDHREISDIYEYTQQSAALIRFLNDGNIRIMAETPGIDISEAHEPTAAQYAEIKRFVREYAGKRLFMVDISGQNDTRIGTYTYDGRVNADRVVNDIKYYFRNGSLREQSTVASFHYSQRDPLQEKAVKALEKENAQLKEDVGYLKEMLKLQRSMTGGTKFTKSSVEAMAGILMKNNSAKGSKAELAAHLNGLYEYIAKGEELTWEGVTEMAQPAVEWIQSHIESKPRMDEYATEILRKLRTSRVYLDESQKQEAAYLCGSYNDFRKQMLGTIVVSDKASVSLDTQWGELASLYPGVFDATTSASDMPRALMEAVDSLRGMNVIDEWYNRADVTQDLLRQVYDGYWKVSTLQTVADVKQKQINRLKAEHNTRMEKIKSDHREKIDRLKTEHHNELLCAKVRYLEAGETVSKNKQRKIIEKQVKDLTKMIANPTKDAHVPTVLHKPLQKLLDSLDFTSEKMAGGGEATVRDVAYTRALQSIRTAIAAQRTAMEGVEDGAFALDVPPEFLDKIDEHIKMINDATEGMDLTTNRVYDMSSDELKDLAYLLGTINKAVRNIDKLHMEGAKARVSELAESTVREMGQRKPVKGEDGGGLMWANYTPTYAFERMGTAATQILDGLKQGQAKMARTVDGVLQFAAKTYDAKEVKAWQEKIHTVKLESGETVKLSTAQIMSFYCLSNRNQGVGHLTGGGIRVGTIGEGLGKIVQSKDFVLTVEDINQINGLLDKRQLEVAKAMQKYMQDVGGRLGNEISMARWGFMQMTEENYFPVKSHSNSLDAKAPGQEKANLFALLNKSFTKSTKENANNVIVVNSIFDVFADHMAEMAEYNAFALPLVDAMKWYNYRRTTHLDGTQIETVGVKKSLNDTLGTAAGKYFIDLMMDINGSQKGGRHEDIMGKLLSYSKAAAVGWNLRVAIQQPTAILRASLYLDMPDLARGSLRIGTKELVEEMQQYSGIALWKSLGYYDLNVSRSVREQIKGNTNLVDTFNEWGMWLPGKVDEITWARIWAACKSKVSRTQNLKGEALLKETAKLFDDVVYHTQVVDSVLTKSYLMRDKTLAIKELTSFMSEPTLSVNILMSAFQDYRQGKTNWEKAKRTFAICFKGYALSAMANALATSLMDAIRDDDEYEEFWEKYKQALLGENFWDGNLFSELNPLEKVVSVRDVLSAIKGHDVKNQYAELIQSCIDLVNNIKKYLEGKGSITEYGVIYNALKVLGNFTGAAPANLARELVTIWNNTFGKLSGKKIHRYQTGVKDGIHNAFDAGTLTREEAIQELVLAQEAENEDEAYFQVKKWETGEDSKYSDLYGAAQKGESIDAAMEDLTSHGMKEKDVLTTLRNKLHTWYTDPESEIRLTREETVSRLKKYTDLGSDEIQALVKKWDMELEAGFTYSELREQYVDGNISEKEAISYMQKYGGKTKEEAQDQMEGWTKDRFFDGDINADEAAKVLTNHCGWDSADAENKVRYWDFKRSHPDLYVDDAWMEEYDIEIRESGIALETFVEYRNKVKGIAGEGKKDRRMAVIDSLPITDEQKDAIYFAEGWAESTLHDAPWH